MNTTAIAALVGVVMPIIVTLVKQAKLKPVYNALIAIGVCAAAGTLVAYFNGSFNGVDVATAILAVFAVATAMYETFWRLVPMAGLETVLNEKTSVS